MVEGSAGFYWGARVETLSTICRNPSLGLTRRILKNINLYFVTKNDHLLNISSLKHYFSNSFISLTIIIIILTCFFIILSCCWYQNNFVIMINLQIICSFEGLCKENFLEPCWTIQRKVVFPQRSRGRELVTSWQWSETRGRHSVSTLAWRCGTPGVK